MAYTTDKELEAFRQKIQQKYGGLARSNGRTLGVGGSFDEGGVRYTGAGPNDFVEPKEPAGIAHEGEMVIEEPTVKKAGGANAVRAEIEGLRGAEKKGMPGFQAGTDSVPDVETLGTPKAVSGGSTLVDPAPDLRSSIGKAGGDLAKSGTISGLGTFGAKTGDVEGVDKLKTVSALGDVKTGDTESLATPTAAPTTGGGVGFDDPKTEDDDPINYKDLARGGIEGIQDIAGGKSEAARLARERSQSALAGEQAASRIARRQELAQAGAEGGTVDAAMARLGREERLAKTALEGELATGEAERAETAQYKLADIGNSMMLAMKDIGFKEESMDLAWAGLDLDKDQADFLKSQWGDKMGMWGDEFKRDSDQWGEEYALRQMATNWDMQQPVLQMMLEGGQFEGASKILSNFGLGDVDLSGIEDDYARGEVVKGSIGLTTLLTENPAAGIDNPEVKGELDRIYNNLAVKPENKDEWYQEKVDAIKIATHPVHSAMSAYTDDDLTDMAASYGWTADEQFEFNGYTGNEAVRLALSSSMMPGGGMTIDDQGSMTFSANSAIGQLMAGPGGPEEPVVRTETQIQEDRQVFQESVNKGETPTAEDIAKNVQTISEGNIPFGGGVNQWLKTNAESNPGGWINVDGSALKVEQGFDNGSRADTVFLVDTEGNKYTRDENGKWYTGWHQQTEAAPTAIGPTRTGVHPDVAGQEVDSPIG